MRTGTLTRTRIFRTDPTLDAALEAMAAREGVNVSAFMRRALAFIVRPGARPAGGRLMVETHALTASRTAPYDLSGPTDLERRTLAWPGRWRSHQHAMMAYADPIAADCDRSFAHIGTTTLYKVTRYVRF